MTARTPARLRSLAGAALIASAWCCAGLLGAGPTARSEALRPLEAFPRERIVVETRGARRHVFDAWRADTPETRAQGLMFVTGLRPDQAMIFVYAPAERAGMWMKNTLIPLDMLFVDGAGCIVHLHEQARPGSLATIGAGQPVELVVELAGGTARALRISVGDRLSRPDADWPERPGACTASP
jgi:uncharacterized membrane protein (UPF0127 family)